MNQEEIAEMRKELAEIKSMVQELVAPQKKLKIIEMANIVREAHASGDPQRIRHATKITTGRAKL